MIGKFLSNTLTVKTKHRDAKVYRQTLDLRCSDYAKAT